MANPLNFLQLTPENIAQAKGMSWGQAFSQDFNPKNPNYRGFSTAYKGADRTGLGKYVTGGIKSLAGMFEPGSNVGGATPLTRKLALGTMNIAPRISGVLGPLAAYESLYQGRTKPMMKDIQTATDLGLNIEDYITKDGTQIGLNDMLYSDMNKVKAQRFKQQQLMNQRKQQMQQTIRQAEAAEAAKQKAAADAAAKATSNFDPSGPTQASIRRDRADKSGRGHSGGFTDPGKGSYGPHKADGGLINFYRYGGFIG